MVASDEIITTVQLNLCVSSVIPGSLLEVITVYNASFTGCVSRARDL